jgi:hypothetical protein
MKDGYLIIYKGNHYIVNDEQIVEGDLYVTIDEPYRDKVDYKVLWCFEKEQKYARVYKPFNMPFVSGVTASLISADLVPVQPIAAPRGELYYIDFVYTGSTISE